MSVLRELWLAVRLVGELVWLARIATVVVLAVAGVLVWAELDEWAVVVVLAIAALVVWGRVRPASFDRHVRDRLVGRVHKRQLRRSWSEWAAACKLDRIVDGEHTVPRLRRVRWRQGTLSAEPVLLAGQSVDDYDRAAERLRTAAKARRLRVRPNAQVTGCVLVWSFGDHLTRSFEIELAAADAPATSRDVYVGCSEDGQPWLIDIARSTLVAGATGSGKASVMWSTIFGLGPAIRARVVEVHGVDLKGGMELGMGRAMFARYATTPGQAVVLLEEAAAAMQQRAGELAGSTRQHVASKDRPLVVVVVDELASVVAYVRDRDLRTRAEAALSLLLSQGRAVGYVVWGFVQDPRRDVVGMRNLFPRRIGLRLDTAEEVVMVLGEGATAAGAACHRIPPETPGVGYVIDEGGRPVKVRAPLVSDDALKIAAHRFAAPIQTPVIVPEEPERPRRRQRESVATVGRS